jgi:septal ring factor EnvC (AmiA/AmiB activator)
MRIIAIFTAILFSFSAFAQQGGNSRAELEKKRQSILESIKQTEAELAATRQNKQATLSQLRALQAKLNERQRLVNNISAEIGAINSNIQLSAQEVNTLKRNLEVLKTRYAQSVRYAYSNRSSYNMLAFLFSAKDFNDAARRAKYLKKYRDYRKDQVAQIQVTRGQIENKITELNREKQQKDVLFREQEEQKKVIQKETNETNQVVNELKGREKNLSAQIEKNRKATRQLDKSINEMIRREIELARKKAEEEARKKAEEERKKQLAAAQQNTVKFGSNDPGTPATTTKPSTVTPSTTGNTTTDKPIAANVPPKPTVNRPPVNLSLTPEAAALASNFESNRGRLPWPVEKGFIAGRFGVHPHPVETRVMVENNGVSIRTGDGAVARAVFEGTVTNVFQIPGAGWNILIAHGNYFTVYSGLSSTRVRKGDQVHTKQAIGTVGLNDEGDNVINFQIWKGASKMDPEGWIAR